MSGLLELLVDKAVQDGPGLDSEGASLGLPHQRTLQWLDKQMSAVSSEDANGDPGRSDGTATL